MRQSKAFLRAYISLLLLILLIAFGSLTPANSAAIKHEKNETNYNAANNISEDVSSSMAPNEGDIPEWRPVPETAEARANATSVPKSQPGFDIFMASFLIAALSAVQIKRRSQTPKKN